MVLIFSTDLDGVIQAIVPDDWDRFAVENGAPELLDHSILLGRPLVDFIAGAPTKTATRTILHQLRTGIRPSVSYHYACDSPDTARTMRMTITRFPDRLEFRSSLLVERSRMVHMLLGFSPNSECIDLPIMTVCSVCKRLQDPVEDENWLDAEAYESEGGDTNVRISHGLCTVCMSSLLETAS